jgi:hypothetical protein
VALAPPAEAAAARTPAYAHPRVVALRKAASAPLGLSIKGGRDMDMPVVISAISPGGAIAGTQQLYVGDEILAVNGQSLAQALHAEAVDILRDATAGVRLHGSVLSRLYVPLTKIPCTRRRRKSP